MAFDPLKIRNSSHCWEAVPRDVDGNLRFRGEMMRWLDEVGEDAEKYLLEWCRKDVFFWFDTLVWTVDPRRHPGHPFRPWITLPFQREELISGIEESMGDPWSLASESSEAQIGHDLCLKKTRDVGATVALMGCAGRRFICFNNTLGVFVSISEDLVDIPDNPNTMFGKLDDTIKRLPVFMREDVERNNCLYRKRSSGSILEGMGTTGQVTRSGRPHFIVADEFAGWTLSKSTGFLKASAAASSCRIFCSTCQGLDNGFHQVATDVNIPRIEILWTKHPWHSMGMYRAEGDGKVALVDAEFWSEKTFGWLQRRFPMLGKRYKGIDPGARLKDVYQFVTEVEPPEGLWDGFTRSPYYDHESLRYPAKWMRAQELNCDFVGSGNPFFDPSELSLYIRKHGTPPMRRGKLHIDQLSFEPLAFRESGTGECLLWFNPSLVGAMAAPSKTFDYQMGVDVSGGTGASWSSASVWNCNTAEKIFRYRRNDLRPGRWAEEVFGISQWFHNAQICFEGGGIGTDFAGRLLELKANVYRMKEKDGAYKKTPGWHYNGDMKRALLEKYATALFRGHLTNHDIEALSEGFHFQTGSDALVEHTAALNSLDAGGSKANHGDDFMADVLAYYGMTQRGFAAVEKMVRKKVEPGPWERYDREQRERSRSAMHWG